MGVCESYSRKSMRFFALVSAIASVLLYLVKASVEAMIILFFVLSGVEVLAVLIFPDADL